MEANSFAVAFTKYCPIAVVRLKQSTNAPLSKAKNFCWSKQFKQNTTISFEMMNLIIR